MMSLVAFFCAISVRIREKAGDYSQSQAVDFIAYPLRSPNRPIPLDYSISDIFCSTEGINSRNPSLFDQIAGDVQYKYPIHPSFGNDVTSFQICEKNYTSAQVETIKSLISNNYRVSLSVDGLPISSPVLDSSHNRVLQAPGFPVGHTVGTDFYLHNYYEFKISRTTSSPFRIVGFELITAETRDASGMNISDSTISAGDPIKFFYSLHWEPMASDPSSRWLPLLPTSSNKVQWISISNSFLLIICLSVIFYVVVLRTIKSDSYRSDQLVDTAEDPLEEVGWKLVHGDVFRPPTSSHILTSIVGSGSNLILSTLAFLLLSSLGYFSPSCPGKLYTEFAIAYMIFSPISGFISARIYRTIGDKAWRRGILESSLCLPITMLVGYSLPLIMFKMNGSSGTIGYKSFTKLLLFLAASVLLFVVGSFVGLRKAPIELPARVTQLPRQIPAQPHFLSPFSIMLIGGALVFSSVMVESYFVLISIWTGMEYYSALLILLVAFIEMMATSSIVSILAVYLKLSYENYFWWWSSVIAPGSSGIGFLIYSAVFMTYCYKPADSTSAIVFMSVSALVSCLIFFVNGTAGFLSSFAFMRQIYASLKME